MTYLFEVKKKRKQKKPVLPAQAKVFAGRTEISEDPPIGLIQGMVPDSVQEWRFGLALDRLGHTYEYQKPINSGRRLRGGQVIDYWITSTVPWPTAAFIQGGFWHGRAKESEDKMKQNAVKKKYGNQVYILLIPAEEELTSVRAAIKYCRENLNQ